MAVAEKLGYRPNTVARSLVQRATATIGLIAGDITDVALSQFAVAAEHTARRHGHAVLVGNLAEGGEDGASVAADADRAAGRRDHRRRPAARGGHRGRRPAAPVRPRGQPASRAGRRRPAGRLQPPRGRPARHRAPARARATPRSARSPGRSAARSSRSRLHGYEDALRDAGHRARRGPGVEADWTPGGAAAATRLLLQRAPGMTAIFVHSDTMAIGVLSALAAAGRRVPADVAVVSCDDMPFAEYLIPSLPRCGCRSPRPASRPSSCCCAASPGSRYRTSRSCCRSS